MLVARIAGKNDVDGGAVLGEIHLNSVIVIDVRAGADSELGKTFGFCAVYGIDRQHVVSEIKDAKFRNLTMAQEKVNQKGIFFKETEESVLSYLRNWSKEND